MEQYLIQLIKVNNRVIIPEIGALIARNQDPLEIGFNGVLSFNDGLLTGHVIQAEGVTFKEANDKVMAYKDDILDQLKKKGEVSLKGIGKITMDAAGNKLFAGSGGAVKDTGKADAEAKKKADEDKAKADVEVKKKADEDKAKADVEVKKKADEDKAKADVEVKKKADEDKAKADVEAKKKADEDKAKVDAEAKKKADEDKTKVEAEAKKKADEEKAKADAEAKKKLEEDKIKANAEAKKKADEEKAKLEAESKKKPEPQIKIPAASKEKAEKTAFTLDDSLKEVDVDATQDIKDVKPAKDDAKSKPPFTLDDAEKITTEDPAARLIEPESKDKPEPKPVPIPVPKPEPVIEATLVTEKAKPKYVVKESRTPKYPPPPPIEEKKVTTAPSRKKKRLWIIPVAIVALLIIALVAGYFFFPEQLNRILPEKIAAILPERGQQIDEPIEPVEAIVDEAIVEEPAETTEDVAEETTTPVEEPVQEEPAEVVTAEIPTGKQYYIVAGCFENRAYADKYASELQQEGYNSSVFGTRPGNLHAVCFDSFSSMSEALAEMNRIRQAKEPNAWVLYY